MAGTSRLVVLISSHVARDSLEGQIYNTLDNLLV